MRFYYYIAFTIAVSFAGNNISFVRANQNELLQTNSEPGSIKRSLRSQGKETDSMDSLKEDEERFLTGLVQRIWRRRRQKATENTDKESLLSQSQKSSMNAFLKKRPIKLKILADYRRQQKEELLEKKKLKEKEEKMAKEILRRIKKIGNERP
ncbi:unnamed protein product [Peronospora belbahrii]|uniref:RxLR effector protein n=1 Tax=Peronospora belbahrii TaxID=622444 RepID=A0AAU9KMI1_9STRA|nr:unnamed protein product [Peronospora belbahrii]